MSCRNGCTRRGGQPIEPLISLKNTIVRQAKKSRQGYYASITFIDEQIGRILTTLKKRGMYDNTLIILFSDHGDSV